MAKVNVYIDGFNFYYGTVKGSPYKWLDLGALCRRLLPNDDIQTIEYFTAIVSARPYDPDLPVRQQMYLRALKTVPNLRIVYGHFLTHSCRMMLTGSNPPKRCGSIRRRRKARTLTLRLTFCAMPTIMPSRSRSW